MELSLSQSRVPFGEPASGVFVELYNVRGIFCPETKALLQSTAITCLPWGSLLVLDVVMV